MKYTYTAAALVSFVLAAPAMATGAPPSCGECVDTANQCRVAKDANQSTCSSNLAACLAAAKSRCDENDNKCRGVQGANLSTCASEKAACLAECPKDNSTSVVVSSTVAPTQTSVQPTATPGPKKDCKPSDKSCEDQLNECIQGTIAKPGQNIGDTKNRASCEADAATCRALPLCKQGDRTATVKESKFITVTSCSEDKCHPTPHPKPVCTDDKCSSKGHAQPTNGVHTTPNVGPKPTGTAKPTAVIAGADNIKPGLALLALGAAALL